MPRLPGLLCLFLTVLCLKACAESTEPVRRIHTAFSESSGLTVVDGLGNTQQLTEGSLAAEAIVSSDGRWILVEDMQMSNLVVVRTFKLTRDGYREVSTPDLRQHWLQLAEDAGLTFEDLEHTRVGAEGFGPFDETVMLHFQADSGLVNSPVIDALVEVELSTNVE